MLESRHNSLTNIPITSPVHKRNILLKQNNAIYCAIAAYRFHKIMNFEETIFEPTDGAVNRGKRRPKRKLAATMDVTHAYLLQVWICCIEWTTQAPVAGARELKLDFCVLTRWCAMTHKQSLCG